MYWRNSYNYKDSDLAYFENKKKTNYTYAESLSYRIVSDNQVCDEPYLMRESIHKNITGINTDNCSEMSARKSTSDISVSSVLKTPINKKKVWTSSDRVLRSGNHVTTNVTFVRENDLDYDNGTEMNSYSIGSLNTNSNNSGPDELDDDKSRKTTSYQYDLSGDEDISSDIEPRNKQFGSNNANSKRPPLVHRERLPTQWFQKNMFGLPNEESDDLNQDLSGAISGDEQYDITPYQKIAAKHKSRTTKPYSKQIKKFENIFCSPLAMISFVLEFIWYSLYTVTTLMFSHVRRAIYNSKVSRCLMMPFNLTSSLFQTMFALFAYSTDRLFGTSLCRRINTQHRSKKSIFNNWLSKIILFLIFLIVLFVLFRWFVKDPIESTNSQSSDSIIFNLTDYTYRFVGVDCMIKEDCCHNYLALTRRYIFCLFSLPARLIASNNDQLLSKSTFQESPKIITDNISNIAEILYQIESRLKFQDKKLSDYNLKLNNIIKDSEAKFQSFQSDNSKISTMAKNVQSVSDKISVLQSELVQLKGVKTSIEMSIENLTESQKENFNLASSNIRQLKEKLNIDIKSMIDMIKTNEQHSLSNSESTAKLENWLDQLKIDIDNYKKHLHEVENKTLFLENSNKQIIFDSVKLKQDIIKEVSEELKKFKSNQNQLITNMNEQISLFERTISQQQSKLFDKEYLKELIEIHFNNIKSNIKDEINSTVWNDLQDQINSMVSQSADQTFKQYKTANSVLPLHNEKSCNSKSSNCRCPKSLSTCVRFHHVRRLLSEALSLFAADKIGMADFALESAGGTIATTRCTETYTDRASTLTIFGIPLLRLTNSPRTIIQPSLNPGECWPMKGNRGSVVVQLSDQVRVTAVSIDHIPKSLSPSESIDSAIQNFEIKALTDDNDKLGTSLGNFTYKMDSNPVQTFYIQEPVETKFVELIVNSNYGNKEYTCIYRFRVHGKLVKI